MADTPPADSLEMQKTQDFSTAIKHQQKLPQGASVGRYVILKLIGSGGAGIVYSAYDPDLDRKIAIKLLQNDQIDPKIDSTEQSHLMHEARALAQLSHPNVLPIFDFGRFGDQFFLAMEFVEGKTLYQLQEETSPKWQQVLSWYLSAGYGLAAAHNAGIVHRDFKPQNVMLGSDHQVRVMDFGLATSSSKPANPEGENKAIATDQFSSSLTATGSLLGTPAYMSPEQLRSGKTAFSSDQFSFAVAAYEALYQERPFAGESPAELLENINNNEIRPAISGTKIPGWLRRVLLQALNVDPTNRYQSMDELLLALAHDPARTRNRWLTGVAASLAIASISMGVYSWQQQAAQLCKGAVSRLAGIWDISRKETIEKAFLATQLPYAPNIWRTVESSLDQYTQQWTTTYTQACEATHKTGEQSENILDLRMNCLNNRHKQVAALSDALSLVDTTMMNKTVTASGALSALSYCNDTDALTAVVPPPDSPQNRQVLDRLEVKFAEAKVAFDTGHTEEAGVLTDALLPKAEQLAYKPFLAKLLILTADINDSLDQWEVARDYLQRAALLGVESRDNQAAALAATMLVYSYGFRIKEYAIADQWARWARALLEAAGGNKATTALLLSNEGNSLDMQNKLTEGLEKDQQAYVIRQSFLNPDDLGLAKSANNLGVTLRMMGRYKEALEYFTQSEHGLRASLGDRHPLISVVMSNIGLSYYYMDDLDKAEEILNEAASLSRETNGARSTRTADILIYLGGIAMDREQYPEALEYLQEVDEIHVEILGETHPWRLSGLINLANAYFWVDQHERSAELLEFAMKTDTWEKLNALSQAEIQYRLALEYFKLAVKEDLVPGLITNAYDVIKASENASVGPMLTSLKELAKEAGVDLVNE